jgi:D-sedoheptulose 7-phosphate isomerase
VKWLASGTALFDFLLDFFVSGVAPMTADKSTQRISAALQEAIAGLERLSHNSEPIGAAGKLMAASLQDGGKVMFCGNGGSAADAQHLAAELTGRFLRDRAPLAALALTVDTSALTAIANDFGYDHVFSRQLRGIGRKGDTLVAISTSGRSPNVIEAIRAARDMGIATVGLTGSDGGQMRQLCNVCIAVPAERTDHIQQLHITVGHILCGLIEDGLC